jgi:hypothetical protein
MKQRRAIQACDRSSMLLTLTDANLDQAYQFVNLTFNANKKRSHNFTHHTVLI